MGRALCVLAMESSGGEPSQKGVWPTESVGGAKDPGLCCLPGSKQHNMPWTPNVESTGVREPRAQGSPPGLVVDSY